VLVYAAFLNKKIAFMRNTAENKFSSSVWHYHLFLQADRFTTEKLYNALAATAKSHKLTIRPQSETSNKLGFNLDIEPITTYEQLVSYDTGKAYKTQRKGICISKM